MNNDKYLVNISYVPKRINGQQSVSIAGVTQSIPSYSDEYFVASMPEVKISATGSSRSDALTNLEIIAGSASNTGNPPLSTFRTW